MARSAIHLAIEQASKVSPKRRGKSECLNSDTTKKFLFSLIEMLLLKVLHCNLTYYLLPLTRYNQYYTHPRGFGVLGCCGGNCLQTANGVCMSASVCLSGWFFCVLFASACLVVLLPGWFACWLPGWLAG